MDMSLPSDVVVAGGILEADRVKTASPFRLTVSILLHYRDKGGRATGSIRKTLRDQAAAEVYPEFYIDDLGTVEVEHRSLHFVTPL